MGFRFGLLLGRVLLEPLLAQALSLLGDSGEGDLLTHGGEADEDSRGAFVRVLDKTPKRCHLALAALLVHGPAPTQDRLRDKCERLLGIGQIERSKA